MRKILIFAVMLSMLASQAYGELKYTVVSEPQPTEPSNYEIVTGNPGVASLWNDRYWSIDQRLDAIETTGAATPLIDDDTMTSLEKVWSAGHLADYVELLNGTILQTIDIDITESGGTVSLTVQAEGGGDLQIDFSAGHLDFDSTPAASVALTAGSDISPTLNYVYILQSTGALTSSTASFPLAEHAPIATVLVQSAASVATDEPYKVHAHTDHIKDSNDQGHLSHIGEWIRARHATWLSGAAPTLTITVVGGSDTVIFTSTAGIVNQLHDHIFPAFTGTPDMYIVNDNSAAFTILTDLNGLTADSTGSAFSNNSRFTIVVWGVVSEDTDQCKLMVNLPSGFYNNDSAALLDESRFTNFDIPADFKGTGFLIASYTLKFQTADSGTFSLVSGGDRDLRGLFPSIVAGGGITGATEFATNVFRLLDSSDPTKEIAFDASGITTATTRTFTVPDVTGTLVVSGMTGPVDFEQVSSFQIPADTGDAPLSKRGEIYIDSADDAIAMFFASTGEIFGEAQISALYAVSVVLDPGTHFDTSSQVFMFTLGDEAPNGITIDEWRLSCNVDPDVELDMDLKRATAWIGLGTATVMDILDTTNGISSEDTDANINSGAVVANGQVIYLEIGADPEGTCEQMIFEMWYHVEED